MNQQLAQAFLAAGILGFLLAALLLRRQSRAKAKQQRTVRPGNDPVLVSEDDEWLYEKAPHSDAQVLLLTVGDVLVRGFWRGELGDEFKAWHPVPKRNKQRERELGLLYSERRP